LLIPILVHEIDRVLREQFSPSNSSAGDPVFAFDAVAYYHFRELLGSGSLTERSLRDAMLTV
jgi:hypothetical protein